MCWTTFPNHMTVHISSLTRASRPQILSFTQTHLNLNNNYAPFDDNNTAQHNNRAYSSTQFSPLRVRLKRRERRQVGARNPVTWSDSFTARLSVMACGRPATLRCQMIDDRRNAMWCACFSLSLTISSPLLCSNAIMHSCLRDVTILFTRVLARV